VRVTVELPAQVPGVVTVESIVITGEAALQPPVAVGATKTGVAGQLTGVVCGAQVMTTGAAGPLEQELTAGPVPGREHLMFENMPI
jgi:hypothetical protein